MLESLPCWNSSAVCTAVGDVPACNTTLVGHPQDHSIIYSPTETTILGISAVLLTLLGTLANGLLISSLLLAPRIRALSTTPFIISLCTSDLLFSIYLLPVFAARYLNRKDQGEEEGVICQSGPVIFYTLVRVTALTFVIISVQRAGSLFFREKVERVFSSKTNIVLVLLCWTICLVNIASDYFYKKVIRVEYDQACYLVNKNYRDPGQDQDKTLLLVVYVLLFLVLLISNTAMMIKIKLETNFNAERREEHIFIFMMFISFIAWTLFHLPYVLVNRFDSCFKHTSLHAAAFILNFLKVVISPIIFIFMDIGFKKAVFKLVSRSTQCASGNSRQNFVTVPSFELEAPNKVSTS